MGFWSSIFRRSTAISTPTAPRRLQTRRYRAPRPANSADGFMPASGHERVPSALRTISARARDLAHNNPHAKRAVTVLTANAIGKGVRFSFVGDQAYDAAFFEWATEPDNCDHEKRLTLYGLQYVATRTMFEAGDCFIIMREVRGEDGNLRLTLQLVDPDLVDTGARPKTDGHQCISGVEVNKEGLIVGYHFRSAGESSGPSTFVAAEDVIHLFETVYPGQLRGIPRGAQALLYVDDLAALMTAVIAKARVEACVGIFITRESDDEGGAIIGDDAPEAEAEDETFIPEMMEPGLVMRGKPGDKISTVIPSPGSGVIEYMRVGLRAIAVSYDVTYAQLSGDNERTTFSSEKSGRMDFNRINDSTSAHFLLTRFSKIEKRFRAIYQANGGTVADALEVTIVPPGRERIEPAKEVLAIMTEMAAGLKTYPQACLEVGVDPEVQLKEMETWNKRFAEKGVPIKFGSFDLTAALAAAVAADAQADASADNSTSSEIEEE